MEIILAGYNLDNETINQLVSGEEVSPEALTPETISAAYARISRDSRPVNELRAVAREDVAKAKKSAKTIVFGLGHHSVAEHAVFNFDVLGVSRLAIEALEQHRIGVGFTEKSQRYITLDGDYVMPTEFTADERELFNQLVGEQNDFYFKVLPELERYQREANPEMWKDRNERRTLQGWAKEDARYVLSLATEGQLGYTANARALEHTLRRLKHHHLAEVRDLGERLYEKAKEVAPSLIILADEELFLEAQGGTLEDKFFEKGRTDRIEATENLLRRMDFGNKSPRLVKGRVVNVEGNDPDIAIMAALIYESSKPKFSYSEAMAISDLAFPHEREGYIGDVLKNLGKFDSVPREFEMGKMVFDLIVSSSCYAQLKRHRLCTQLVGDYNPELGVVVPESIEAIGRKGDFLDLVGGKTGEFYRKIQENHPENPRLGEYGLTNAHQRQVLVGMNMRELYHFSRLREDAHAQWDIRETAKAMSIGAKELAPATTMLLGGKHEFDKIKERVYR